MNINDNVGNKKYGRSTPADYVLFWRVIFPYSNRDQICQYHVQLYSPPLKGYLVIKMIREQESWRRYKRGKRDKLGRKRWIGFLQLHWIQYLVSVSYTHLTLPTNREV